MAHIKFIIPTAPVGRVDHAQQIRVHKDAWHVSVKEALASRLLYIHQYKATKNTAFQDLVAGAFNLQYPKHKPWPAAAFILVVAFYPIPKSTPKYKRELMKQRKILPIIKPDFDNVLKNVCDGLKGLAWEDDKQVQGVCFKFYSENPRVAVRIYWEFDAEKLLKYILKDWE